MKKKFPIYVSTQRPWDSDKYPYSNNDRKNETGAAKNEYSDFLNFLHGARCEHLTVAPDLQSLVFAKGDVRLDIDVANITSLDKLGNILKINSEDEVPYYINFVSEEQQMLVEQRLFTVMNGGADPGCGFGNGDFNNSDFSSDFS